MQCMSNIIWKNNGRNLAMASNGGLFLFFHLLHNIILKVVYRNMTVYY